MTHLLSLRVRGYCVFLFLFTTCYEMCLKCFCYLQTTLSMLYAIYLFLFLCLFSFLHSSSHRAPMSCWDSIIKYRCKAAINCFKQIWCMKIQIYPIIKVLRKMNAFILEFHEGYNTFTSRLLCSHVHAHARTHTQSNGFTEVPTCIWRIQVMSTDFRDGPEFNILKLCMKNQRQLSQTKIVTCRNVLEVRPAPGSQANMFSSVVDINIKLRLLTFKKGVHWRIYVSSIPSGIFIFF